MTNALVMTHRFTLPALASIQQLNEALAILAGFTYVDTVDDRVIYNKWDAKHNQDLKHVILTAADWGLSSTDERIALVKSLNCFTIWNPIQNGTQLKSLIPRDINVRANMMDEKGGLSGTWTLSTTQHTEMYNKSSARVDAKQPQVVEDYTGQSLMETAARGLLGINGRFKDVFIYFHKQDVNDPGSWRHIALNTQQRARMMRHDWEGFHRRFIWFPSLNPYAYVLHTAGFSSEAWDRKVELAKKEVEDRKQWKTKEDLRDFLENYRYRDKGVFDDNRLPKGLHSGI